MTLEVRVGCVVQPNSQGCSGCNRSGLRSGGRRDLGIRGMARIASDSDPSRRTDGLASELVLVPCRGRPSLERLFLDFQPRLLSQLEQTPQDHVVVELFASPSRVPARDILLAIRDHLEDHAAWTLAVWVGRERAPMRDIV